MARRYSHNSQRGNVSRFVGKGERYAEASYRFPPKAAALPPPPPDWIFVNNEDEDSRLQKELVLLREMLKMST
ncbi:unnamed protein product [Hydatigera taeniaeformis]|uniref:39S ribosomal protein L52, mitochondrial n=1 Tax=Hydatigena taeniaeformis TaxID=6205 RepID=A0A0R3X973_HYDTA|nr:unnamed protein product [Hydatigera taeniaeformis]